MAATRARDLLVVAAIGEKEHEGGWLEPLLRCAVSAAGAVARRGRRAGVSEVRDTTVLNRPPDMPEESQRASRGCTTPRAGSHEVVWFDPAALRLECRQAEGIENEQVLKGSPEQAVEGDARSMRRGARGAAERIAAGSVPRVRVTTAERLTRCEDGEEIEVETVTLDVAEGRPAGGASAASCTTCWRRSRAIGGSGARWRRSAAASTARARRSARRRRRWCARCWSGWRARCAAVVERHREWPVMVRLSDGRLVDGRIDLAWSDGARWTVVDYKTDRREKRNVAQVQAYGLAVRRATGMPVRCVVLEV